MTEEHKNIKKGFNHGYALFKSNESLAVKLCNGFQVPYGSYEEGFVSGVVEIIKERGLDVSRFISPNQKQSKNRDR